MAIDYLIDYVIVIEFKTITHLCFFFFFEFSMKKWTFFLKLYEGKSNCCYCLLDGDVTKDNGILQLTFQHFLKQVYKQTSKSSHSASPKKEVDSPPKINYNFEPINNVLTLANIYEMSLVNFFEYLAHSMKVIYLPFNAIIDEYNSRLEMLVRMLTRDEYRQLAWPIPELCTTELNSQSWILK